MRCVCPVLSIPWVFCLGAAVVEHRPTVAIYGVIPDFRRRFVEVTFPPSSRLSTAGICAVLFTLFPRVSAGGALLDNVSSTIGIRSALFTAEGGFMLNGIKVPLQVRETTARVGGGPLYASLLSPCLYYRASPCTSASAASAWPFPTASSNSRWVTVLYF